MNRRQGFHRHPLMHPDTDEPTTRAEMLADAEDPGIGGVIQRPVEDPKALLVSLQRAAS